MNGTLNRRSGDPTLRKGAGSHTNRQMQAGTPMHTKTLRRNIEALAASLYKSGLNTSSTGTDSASNPEPDPLQTSLDGPLACTCQVPSLRVSWAGQVLAVPDRVWAVFDKKGAIHGG